ncbi:MAG: hypothetical protein V4560_11740 [Bacteroidota bacterium]
MKLFLTLTCVLFGCSLKAQSIIIPRNAIELEEQRLNILQLGVKAMGVSVTTPAKYIEINHSILPFICQAPPYPRMGSHIFFAFLKKDSSVMITIALLERDSLDYVRDKATINRVRPDAILYNPDKVWRYNFQDLADTINHKSQFYSAKKLKNFNADSGVEFYMTCTNLFLDKYKIERAIILDKKYRGIIEIYYFVRQNAVVNIKKELKNAPKMISYIKKG